MSSFLMLKVRYMWKVKKDIGIIRISVFSADCKKNNPPGGLYVRWYADILKLIRTREDKMNEEKNS